MAVQKYVSDTKRALFDNELMYGTLSRFDRLAQFFSPEALAAMKNHPELKDKIPPDAVQNLCVEEDTCSFDIKNYGRIEITIVEREHPKLIKIICSSSPLPFVGWIQLLPLAAGQTKLRLTLHMEMNMMMKMMIGKKLKQGVNQLADTLCRLPYQKSMINDLPS